MRWKDSMVLVSSQPSLRSSPLVVCRKLSDGWFGNASFTDSACNGYFFIESAEYTAINIVDETIRK